MDEGLAQTRGYLEEFLPPSWTPQGRLSPSQPGWASRAVFLQPAGSRAHAGGVAVPKLLFTGGGYGSRCHVSRGTEGQARSWPCTCF